MTGSQDDSTFQFMKFCSHCQVANNCKMIREFKMFPMICNDFQKLVNTSDGVLDHCSVFIKSLVIIKYLYEIKFVI